MTNQPEGSHVHWPLGYDDADDTGSEYAEAIHRMKGRGRGKSSSWNMRLPNDKFVNAFGTTLEEMKAAGAV